MKVYAFVPAKGSSERIQNKNMRFLEGERLYIKALKTLLQCTEIDRVFLDSESQEMYQHADYLPITFLQRDPALATNKTDGHQMFMNEVNSYPDADIYVQLLCTSPFIKPQTIDEAIRKLKNDASYDSAILMKKDKYYFWKDGQPEYDPNHIPNSKDLPDTVSESMGLYIVKKEAALASQKRYGTRPWMIFGDPQELVDVNNEEDLRFAEVYAKGIKRQESEYLRLVRSFITSPALSDLLDDMFLEKGEPCGAVLSNWVCNLPGSTALGRANTLRLRALEEGEDFHGIYDALESYAGISDNDIIVVENEINDFAYFGDLNATLALRSGASAAVIDGATRDPKQTRFLNFPVFAKKYNAQDVRRRATLDYINKPVTIGGITVTPGDLIFIDECSLVVIFQKYESEVMKRCIQTLATEKNIVNEIINKYHIKDIIDNNGAF